MKCPRLKKYYLTLPNSAAVERIFSIGGAVLSKKKKKVR
jgi:hypothetical protein